MSRAFWASATVVVAVSLTPGVAVAANSKSSRPTAADNRHSDKHAAAVVLAPGAGFGLPAGSPAVRSLQRGLVGLGIPPGPVDGRYGPLTTRAVERFQRAHGLVADGIVGPQTRHALGSGWLFPGAGYLQPGGSPRVRGLQRRLAGAGFSPGRVDGRYGARTAQAVRRFQQAHHLAADGITGTSTLDALGGTPKPHARTPKRPARPHSGPHHRAQHKTPARHHAAPHRHPAGAPPTHRRPKITTPHHGGSTGWAIPVVLAALLIAAFLLLGVRTRRRQAPAPDATPAPAAAAPEPPPAAEPIATPAAMPEPEPAAPSNGRDRAERVITLQQQLSTLGFALGPIDGRYGPLTTQAVERFQHAYGLQADGVVGPLTADALYANAPQPPTNGRIERVKSLQRQLSWLGFEPGPADGKYGPLTTGAVKRFQAANDLQADGIVDQTTADALRQNIAQRPTTDRIDRVKALQRQLEWLGHDPGPIDGHYGSQTTHAVKRFQQHHELPPDGIVDPATHRALQQTVARSGQW